MKHGRLAWPLIIVITMVGASCQSPELMGQLDGAIKTERIRAHLKFLSDDIMGGRAPGQPGCELAAKYIASQFEEAGLQPAVGDSSFYQEIALSGVKCTPAITIRGANRRWHLAPGRDFVAWTEIDQSFVSIRNKEVMFVGYGIEAPEYNWSDYRGVSVDGKVLLMLVNEPFSESPDFFDGPALTYYGRWTYKFEEAIRQGAEGVILIHSPSMAPCGWNVIQNSHSGEFLHIQQTDGTPLLSLMSWLREEKAQEILADAGYDLKQLIAEAGTSTFKPRALNLRAFAALRNESRTLTSSNVIGKVVGSDPTLKDQYIVISSHYDHLGLSDPNLNDADGKDNIFNGAIDNASGVATMLEMARALSESKLKPKRSVLFTAVTAKESGLLGSKYYTENPVAPIEQTIADINLDVVSVWGQARDIIPLGAERSSLLKIIKKVAKEMNMKISGDPKPEAGVFFRSDQFSFSRKGVPSVFLESGRRLLHEQSASANNNWEDYSRKFYHTVDDEYNPNWPLGGTMQMAKFALKTTYELSITPNRPVWVKAQKFRP